MKRYTIKAYTILELTVAMLISSISITIAYTAFSILSRSYRVFDHRNRMIAEITIADKLVKRDFSVQGLVIASGDGMEVRTDSGLITYSFSEQYMLRNQYGLKTDTIRVAGRDVRLSYEQEPVKAGSLVDCLRLTVVADGQAIQRTYVKKYSSADLFDANAASPDDHLPDNHNN